MPSNSSLLLLHDIRDSIGLARECVGSATFEKFATDRRTVYAVSRCLEIISEAARRLPAEPRERNPPLADAIEAEIARASTGSETND
jgi:uncharacterized protein with HEPN domain